MRITRNFPQNVHDIGEQWIRDPVNHDKWQPTGQFLGGVTETFLVSRADGLLAVAKPGLNKQAEAPQAPEKIAADLAYYLDLPIPPVALAKIAPPGSKTEYWVSLSLYFPQCLVYGDAKSVMNERQAEYFDRLASCALVFDTWIGNSDRHEGNCIVADYSTDENEWLGAALIDHGRTTGHTWKTAPIPYSLARFLGNRKHKDLILAKAEQIAALPDSRIRGIIDRLPDEVLAPAGKQLIGAELIRRQAGLRDFLLKET